MLDTHEYGLGPAILRQAADRLEEIFEAVGLPDGVLSDNDWQWGLRCKFWVDDFSVGEVRAHPDGYLALFTDKEKND